MIFLAKGYKAQTLILTHHFFLMISNFYIQLIQHFRHFTWIHGPKFMTESSDSVKIAF